MADRIVTMTDDQAEMIRGEGATARAMLEKVTGKA